MKTSDADLYDVYECPACGEVNEEKLVPRMEGNKPYMTCKSCGHDAKQKRFLVVGSSLLSGIRGRISPWVDSWTPSDNVWVLPKTSCAVCDEAKQTWTASVFIPQSLWDWALDLIQAERREIMLYPSFLSSKVRDGHVDYYVVPSVKTEAAISIAAIDNILLWKDKLDDNVVTKLEDLRNTLEEVGVGWPDSIVIPPQRVSPGYCKRMSAEEAVKAGIAWKPEYAPDFSCVGIHSHVGMGVGHSLTDKESIDANNNVSIVMNHQGEVSAKARMTAPCGHRIVLDATFDTYGDAGRSEWIREGRERAKDTFDGSRWGSRVGWGY